MTSHAAASNASANEPPAADVGSLRKIRAREYALRFGFGAAVSVVAGVVGLLAGSRLGGLFLAFPAILPATLTLLEKKDGVAQAVSDVRGAAIGAVSMLGFALIAVALFPRVHGAAILVALGVWIIASLALYAGLRVLARLLGERQYLPEIPASEARPALEGLRRQGWTIGVAESCTGGLVASMLTTLPGADTVVRGGVVAYTDAVKETALGVNGDTIASRGAVSPEVAREMAIGVARKLGADVGLGVTGHVGAPHDGTSRGLTFIAICLPDERVLLRTYTKDHGAGRNRERDVRMAIRLIVDATGAH